MFLSTSPNSKQFQILVAIPTNTNTSNGIKISSGGDDVILVLSKLMKYFVSLCGIEWNWK